MRLETILNQTEKHQSFVYGSGHLEEGASGRTLVIPIRPRRNGRPVCPVCLGCSGCGAHGPTYDHLAERRFEFLPRWMCAVLFASRMRRVDGVRCGERVP